MFLSYPVRHLGRKIVLRLTLGLTSAVSWRFRSSNCLSCRWLLSQRTEIMSVHPSINQSINPSIYQYVHKGIKACSRQSFHACIHLTIHPSINPFLYPSRCKYSHTHTQANVTYLPTCLSTQLNFCTANCAYACLCCACV